jgi:hypothetical protein
MLVSREKLKTSSKKRCSGSISRRGQGKPCRCWVISRKAITHWRKEERITADQLALAGAVRPLCWWHMAKMLDALAPGTLRKIIGDAYRDGRNTNWGNGLAVLAAMRRADLIPKRKPDRPNPLQQCTATSKRTGQRCGAWRHPGSTVCIWHGALGDPKLYRRWLERKARRAAKLSRTSLGFAPPPETTAMEAEFKSGRKRPHS